MDSLYREIILEHWRDPQNYGEIKNPSFTMKDQNLYCGDSIAFTGKIKKGVLEDVKFTGQGCAISISSASLFTERVKGMKVKEILGISQEEYLKMVGMELGTTRIKCSLFVYSALIMALTSMSL